MTVVLVMHDEVPLGRGCTRDLGTLTISEVHSPKTRNLSCWAALDQESRVALLTPCCFVNSNTSCYPGECSHERLFQQIPK